MCYQPNYVGGSYYSCRKCLACAKTRQNQDYVRCLYEYYTSPCGVMVTLTYNDDSIGLRNRFGKYDLKYSHIQSFMKRLRYYFPHRIIKYKVAGEYGHEGDRPHWHLLIYGVDFREDKVFLKQTENSIIYTSPILEKTWGNGYVSLGELNQKSIRYVLKYITKAVYNVGEWYSKGFEVPPMIRQSTKLGFTFAKRYVSEIVRLKQCVIGEYTYSIPRYFRDKFKQKYPLIWSRYTGSNLRYLHRDYTEPLPPNDLVVLRREWSAKRRHYENLYKLNKL